jgi:hypothetical protein
VDEVCKLGSSCIDCICIVIPMRMFNMFLNFFLSGPECGGIHYYIPTLIECAPGCHIEYCTT